VAENDPGHAEEAYAVDRLHGLVVSSVDGEYLLPVCVDGERNQELVQRVCVVNPVAQNMQDQNSRR